MHSKRSTSKSASYWPSGGSSTMSSQAGKRRGPTPTPRRTTRSSSKDTGVVKVCSNASRSPPTDTLSTAGESARNPRAAISPPQHARGPFPAGTGGLGSDRPRWTELGQFWVISGSFLRPPDTTLWVTQAPPPPLPRFGMSPNVPECPRILASYDSPCQISSPPTASSTTPITSTRLSRLTRPVSLAP